MRNYLLSALFVIILVIIVWSIWSSGTQRQSSRPGSEAQWHSKARRSGRGEQGLVSSSCVSRRGNANTIPASG